MNSVNYRQRRKRKPFYGSEQARRNGGRRGQSRGQAFTSTIDPGRLIRKAIPLEDRPASTGRVFGEMPIDERLKAILKGKGYERPTEIQDKTLEHLLACRDLLGIAQTGTGKTGAFLIPVIHRLITGRKFRTLVVVPTRELAQQVEQEFRSMTKGLNLYSACFIGGTSVNRDVAQLRRQADIVVGTPGRLLDLTQRGALEMRSFTVLVLDEFDRMLDMGFAPDVQRITGAMTSREQTMLFSATLDRSQQALIGRLLVNPVEVKVSSGELTGDHIDQDIIRVREGEDKIRMLCAMVGNPDFGKVLIFAETKRMVKKICQSLQKAGIRAEQIHGDKTQGSRRSALDQFRNGKMKVLVATDVAARGLDISDVTHVINYQLPRTFDSYIHRIGRTGRAGKTGKAFTFVN